MTEGDPEGGASAYGPAIGGRVFTVQGQGGGVVVQLLKGDTELLDHVQWNPSSLVTHTVK
jgi:hypothetical protein